VKAIERRKICGWIIINNNEEYQEIFFLSFLMKLSQKSAGKSGEKLAIWVWTAGIRTGDSLNAWLNGYRYAYVQRQGIFNDCLTF
jgi:hypothetical protein